MSQHQRDLPDPLGNALKRDGLDAVLYGPAPSRDLPVYRSVPAPGAHGLRDALPDLESGARDQIIELVEKDALVRLQATKFDPTYKALWQRVEDAFGRDELVATLRKVRKGKRLEGPTALALLRLAAFPTLDYFGPVDPHPDAADELPDLRLWSDEPDLGWVLPYLGIRPAGGSVTREDSGPLQLELDMPTTVLSLGIALVKAIRPMPARRPLRAKEWEGAGGWKAAFWLLRQQHKRPGRGSPDRARDYIEYLRDCGHLSTGRVNAADYEGEVKQLLREAREQVEMVAEEVKGSPDTLRWLDETLLCGHPVDPDDLPEVRPVIVDPSGADQGA